MKTKDSGALAPLDTEIQVSKVNQYGREEYKPESDIAQDFANLLGQKHLTKQNIEFIKKIGFKIVVRSEKSVTVLEVL